MLERNQNGVPREKRKTGLTCQPPKTALPMPPLFKNRLLLPNGNS
jgi:hypothetical protein